ncbi:MAG TPA: DUF192 domain-containing protein [Bacillus sp. (in: firmicutes)]|uniref:DUF192 domain-containing protein n=1 Tax=Bacillus litorisediminis TaxID=2922713 RepID=UPI001FAB9A2C|nr:DUF192 domain-containing protein [Bacillus litorisediminis]HWO77057.1 DUF192 domain-containing protein [Bacillus sp. (in: firmicutes)]
MKLVNLRNDSIIAEQINPAYQFFKRLQGLMFTKKLDVGVGLHIKPCRSIHTFFMNYTIDVLYLNESNVVVAIDESLEPGKVGKLYSDAHSVVELPSGTVQETGIKVGDELLFQTA